MSSSVQSKIDALYGSVVEVVLRFSARKERKGERFFLILEATLPTPETPYTLRLPVNCGWHFHSYSGRASVDDSLVKIVKD